MLFPNLCYNQVCCKETILYSVFQTVHSDSATMKMVFPSTSQAMGMLIPIYKLHITNTIPTSALCDSIVYGMVRTAIISYDIASGSVLRLCSDFIWDFRNLPVPSHLGKYFNDIGKTCAKIHEIGKIKSILGLGMTPI